MVALTFVTTQPSRGVRPPISTLMGRSEAASARRVRAFAKGLFRFRTVSRIATRVVHRGFRREFIGFNRARHAVLEATILATRTHLIPMEQIRDELAKLQVIVDKTAGPREQEAMAFVSAYVRGR